MLRCSCQRADSAVERLSYSRVLLLLPSDDIQAHPDRVEISLPALLDVYEAAIKYRCGLMQHLMEAPIMFVPSAARTAVAYFCSSARMPGSDAALGFRAYFIGRNHERAKVAAAARAAIMTHKIADWPFNSTATPHCNARAMEEIVSICASAQHPFQLMSLLQAEGQD